MKASRTKSILNTPLGIVSMGIFALSFAYLIFLVYYVGSHYGLGSVFGKSRSSSAPAWDGVPSALYQVPVKSWSSRQVKEWLEHVGISSTAVKESFEENAVDGITLITLTDALLEKDLKVGSSILRSKILREIEVLRESTPSSSGMKQGKDVDSVGIYESGMPMTKESLGTVVNAQEMTISDVKKAASEIMKEEVVALTNHVGQQIQSREDLTEKVYALRKNEMYFFPIEKIGDKLDVYLPTDKRHVELEAMSSEPRVLVVRNLITPDECDEIVKTATPKMQKSTVAQQGQADIKNTYSQVRTSSTAWLPGSSSPAVKRIRKRVEELVKVPMSHAEDMQVLHYAPLQHYHAHHDYFDPNVYPTKESLEGKNRMITVFMYLSDVEQGGETNFPRAFDDSPITSFADCGRGLSVRPSKGDCVIFYSMHAHGHREGSLDPMSLHAGCDVIKGDKWSANYWIRNYAYSG